MTMFMLVVLIMMMMLMAVTMLTMMMRINALQWWPRLACADDDDYVEHDAEDDDDDAHLSKTVATLRGWLFHLRQYCRASPILASATNIFDMDVIQDIFIYSPMRYMMWLPIYLTQFSRRRTFSFVSVPITFGYTWDSHSSSSIESQAMCGKVYSAQTWRHEQDPGGNCETGRSGDRVRQNSNDDWLKCNCTGSGGSPLFGPIRTQNSVASIFLSAELFHSAHIEVENGRQQWVLTCICLDFHSQLYMVRVYNLEHFHMYISLTTGVPWSLGQDKRGRG